MQTQARVTWRDGTQVPQLLEGLDRADGAVEELLTDTSCGGALVQTDGSFHRFEGCGGATSQAHHDPGGPTLYLDVGASQVPTDAAGVGLHLVHRLTTGDTGCGNVSQQSADAIFVELVHSRPHRRYRRQDQSSRTLGPSARQWPKSIYGSGT